MAITTEMVKDSLAGIIVTFVGGLLAVLGYLLKTWKEKIEKEIEKRVTETICQKEHEKHEERRESDKARISNFEISINKLDTDLKRLEDRFNEHIDNHP